MSRVFGGFTPRYPLLEWYRRNEGIITLIGLMIGVALIVTAVIVSMGNRITDGEVYQKLYEPERRWTTQSSIAVGTDPPVYVPMTHHHFDDEDWIIWIRNTGEDNKERTRKLYVSNAVYTSLEIGDWYNYSATSASANDPETKTRERR